MNANIYTISGYVNFNVLGLRKNKPNQSQFQNRSLLCEAPSFRAKRGQKLARHQCGGTDDSLSGQATATQLRKRLRRRQERFAQTSVALAKTERQPSVHCPQSTCLLYSQYATPIKSTAPRRMNGKELEPARILTYYESDFGATPKVQMRKGQVVTVLNPDFAGRRRAFPRCFVSRSKTAGVTYGNYLREVSYAVKSRSVPKWITDFRFSIFNWQS